jgi:hypothetical protein
MSCDLEKIRGTGHDSPAEYRCEVSKETDVAECGGCCTKCSCSCEFEEDEEYCEDCGEPVPEGCFGGCAR